MLSKIEAGLKMPVIRHDKRSATRSPEKEERMVRRLSPGNYERSTKEQERESKKTSGQLGSSVTNAAKEPKIETKTIKRKVSRTFDRRTNFKSIDFNLNYSTYLLFTQ